VAIKVLKNFEISYISLGLLSVHGETGRR